MYPNIKGELLISESRHGVHSEHTGFYAVMKFENYPKKVIKNCEDCKKLWNFVNCVTKKRCNINEICLNYEKIAYAFLPSFSPRD